MYATAFISGIENLTKFVTSLMKRRSGFYIAFFAVLILVFLVALAWFIPGFGKKKIAPIGTVAPFSFTNQDGRQVTQRDIEGKVVAVEYFFTTCKGICPRMNNNLRPVYETFKNEPRFLLLSHTCDPETDSVQRLKAYADSMKVNTDRWVFLTGRKDSLYNMARHSYKIDDPANNLTSPENDFLHTQFVALVNQKGEVVHIYDALKPSELKDMTGAIKKLLR